MSDESESTPRLSRWLNNMKIACSVPIDEAGTRLTPADAVILLDPLHPRHGELFAKIENHLPEEVRRDFQRLFAMSGMKRIAEVESVINHIRFQDKRGGDETKP